MADDRRADAPPGTEAAVLADRLKERIYATITMIAVVVGLSLGDVGSLGAVATVLTTALGLWLAAFVADQQAHRTVHRHLATGPELRRMLYVSSPLLSCAVGPAVLIALAALDVLSLHAALLTAAGWASSPCSCGAVWAGCAWEAAPWRRRWRAWRTRRSVWRSPW
ncbi:hypothetical protein [Streptomyces iakyrus]|uniref:hypothetical protein n=1 Tax=Streptomyces iakyrus TaxID=68219 RepID=UPI003D8BA1B2